MGIHNSVMDIQNSIMEIDISLYRIWLLIHAQPQRAFPLTLGRGWVITSRYFIEPCLDLHAGFNSLRPRQNRRHFADDIFKCIFLNENIWIAIKISLKFVPKGPINNISALVQIMAWRRPGDKPLSEPMMVILPTQNASLGLDELINLSS